MQLAAALPNTANTAIHFTPQCPLEYIQGEMLDLGLVVDQTINLGLAAIWTNCLTESLNEAFCRGNPEREQLRQILGFPDREMSDATDLILWVQSMEKFGWLVRIEKLWIPGVPEVSDANRPHWFYADRLDLALQQAIGWAKGEEA